MATIEGLSAGRSPSVIPSLDQQSRSSGRIDARGELRPAHSPRILPSPPLKLRRQGLLRVLCRRRCSLVILVGRQAGAFRRDTIVCSRCAASCRVLPFRFSGQSPSDRVAIGFCLLPTFLRRWQIALAGRGVSSVSSREFPIRNQGLAREPKANNPLLFVEGVATSEPSRRRKRGRRHLCPRTPS
jgi:hypothetical protein